MEKSKRKSVRVEISIVALALLLISSSLLLLGTSKVTTSSISAQPLSPATNYGDIMQYDWPMGGHDEGQTGFNPGPGPDRPDVLWKANLSGASGYVSVFNGKAFVISGSTLRAYNALTGALVWNTTLLRSASGTGGTTKIDDTYLFVDCNGPEVHRISDGTFVSNYTVPSWQRQPGSGQYYPGAYSSALKIKYINSFNPFTNEPFIEAISLADPTNPVRAWRVVCDEPSEIQAFGEGKLLVGTTQGSVYTLDGRNGSFLWRAVKTGMAQQQGLYYNGNFYQAATSQTVTCWNGSTGKVQWEFDSAVLGERAFYAYRGAVGYGRYYDCAVPNDPHGWVVCWDATSGEMLWKQPAYYFISYASPVVAGGKVYACTCDRPTGQVTAGLVMPGYDFTCFDAFTGQALWKIPGVQFSTPTVAYGNLYAAEGGVVYCIGQTTPAKPWSYGFEGNVDQPRVAVGQSGPQNISAPKWVFATGGEVSSSPAVVDGKVYVGSHDRNWYCLNAYSGIKVWNYSVGYRVMSSAAVVGGRVYTGSDDGNFYCLDANNGTRIWTRSAGGLVNTNVMTSLEFQPRSSPIIVGSNLYAGSMDGKVYCLNTADGSVRWNYTTGGPVMGSPAYFNGTVFIVSTDEYMYALDANTGAFKWRSIQLNFGQNNFNFGKNLALTPIVAEGKVFVGGGIMYVQPMKLAAFNANSGAILWNVSLQGNSEPLMVFAYSNGTLYLSENWKVTAHNTTNGAQIWEQWIGYQIVSSIAYADDVRGPMLYVGSDVGSVTCLSAKDGKPIAAYQAGANIDSSPAIWEGKMYIGSVDRNVYCFDDSPMVDFTLYANSNKGAVMWNNETNRIGGQLLSNPTEVTWTGGGNGSYIFVPSDMHPGLPNATVIVSFTKPDGTSQNVSAVTDTNGRFIIAYNPTTAGDWGWVVLYEGKRTIGITYNAAYTQYNTFKVVAAPNPTPPSTTPISSPTVTPTVAPTATSTPSSTSTPTATSTATPTPTPTSTPTLAPTVAPTASPSPTPTPVDNTMTYAAVGIVVVIVVVVAAAYLLMKRKK